MVEFIQKSKAVMLMMTTLIFSNIMSAAALRPPRRRRKVTVSLNQHRQAVGRVNQADDRVRAAPRGRVVVTAPSQGVEDADSLHDFCSSETSVGDDSENGVLPCDAEVQKQSSEIAPPRPAYKPQIRSHHSQVQELADRYDFTFKPLLQPTPAGDCARAAADSPSVVYTDIFGTDTDIRESVMKDLRKLMLEARGESLSDLQAHLDNIPKKGMFELED